MKHTKGPWRWVGWGGQIEIRTQDNTEIGLAFIGKQDDGAIPTGQRRANAHLIAAAPELLEACKGMLDMYMRIIPNLKISLSSEEITIEGNARKAINKAQGN